MCHYISATFSTNDRSPLVDSIAYEYSVGLKPYTNSTLSQHLFPDEQLYLTTTSHSDCGTALGIRKKLDSVNSRSSAAHQKKLESIQKLGWTETKIRRWKEQQIKSELKIHRSSSDQLEAYLPDANRWHQFIEKCILKAGVSPFGLFYHWYRTSPETESISISKTVNLEVSELTSNSILDFEEDVLYRIVSFRKLKIA